LLLTAFGALALIVGGIGVYSLISYTVSWRTREIGLRLALGANRLQIAELVLRQSLGLAVLGSLLGMAGAVAVTRLMGRFLFETSPLDPLTYAMVPVLFCALALMAACHWQDARPMWTRWWFAQRLDGRSRPVSQGIDQGFPFGLEADGIAPARIPVIGIRGRASLRWR
jgi:hypothetical protein